VARPYLNGPNVSVSPVSVLAAATTFLQLRQYLVEREAAGFLPGRERDVGFQMFDHQFLRWDEREKPFGSPPINPCRSPPY